MSALAPSVDMSEASIEAPSALPGARWARIKTSISFKLGIVQVSMILIALVTGLIGLYALRALDAELARTTRQQAASSRLVNQMLEDARQLSEHARRAVAATAPEERDRALAALAADQQRLGEKVDSLSSGLDASAEVRDTIQQGFSAFVISAVKTGRLIKAGRTEDAAAELNTNFEPKLLAYVLTTVSAIEQSALHANETVAAASHSRFEHSRAALGAAVVLALVTAVLGHMVLQRLVVRPIRQAAQAAEGLAGGRFDLDIGQPASDECGEMLKAMDRLRTRLRTVLQVQRDLLDSSAQNAAIASDKPQQLPGVYGELIEAVQGAVHRGQQDYRAVREELLTVTGAISRGDFSLKLDATHKEGMWRELAEVLNQLTDRLGTALDDIAKQLAQVAAGDLRYGTQREYSGLLGEVVSALGTTSDNLSQIIETIRASADSVAAEAKRIATTNATLATHAELQVDALSRSSTAVDRLTEAAGESAANALEANRLMQSTSEKASLGSDLNARVVAAMQSIQTVTRRVSDFVSVINGVSFQTNILALNAAVEAARAGEHGRSFAVVAGEVRTLASRTADAAREIERLVTEANAQVAAGAELVVQAGTSMGAIVTNVSAATTAIGDISRSSQEQSQDLQDVKRQLDQLRKTTDQTASTIEGAATVSQALVGEANKLLESVAVFQTMGT